MSDPIFPEVVIGPIAYITIGFLLAVIVLLVFRLKTLDQDQDSKVSEDSFDLNMLNLKKSRRDILGAVVEKPVLQSELPSETNFSKSTVSQGIKDLTDLGFIKKKKRGNTYLIEPNLDRIKEKCGTH